MVWIAGTFGYGVFSDLWRRFGVVNLFLVSLECFVIAAAVVHRMYVIGSARRKTLLGLLLSTSLPTVLFAMVLRGKTISAYA
ncbi:MAG: hypothetical protein AAF756_01230 [Pseudomonadota bacterium]